MSTIDYTKPLSPVEEVYGHIVQDLTEAEAVLPTGYSGSPRFLNGVNVYVTGRQPNLLWQQCIWLWPAGR